MDLEFEKQRNIKFLGKKYELSNFRFAQVKTLNINADSVDKRYL